MNNEINDVAPSSLTHIIAQRSAVQQISVALDASFADNRRFDHSLLVGPAGLGKTSLAQVVATEMASKCHQILGQSIEHISDLNAVLLAAEDKDVLFIDEAHELKKPFQTALYLALDQRRISLVGGRSGRAPQSIRLADFTLLLATTDEYSLLSPLVQRMRLVLRLDFYEAEDLTTILLQRARALGWEIQEELLPLIAQRSRGTPRLALRLLQACRRVCRAEGELTITFNHLRRACEMEQIDALGLGPTEQRYLQIVADGPTRLNVIASILGLPRRTVSEVTEAFLLRAGLITKDGQGLRQLTALGREHLSCLRHDNVWFSANLRHISV